MRKFGKMTAAVLAALSVLTATLSGCGSGSKAESTQTSSISVGVANDIDSMDPNKTVSAGTREILFNVYEGLVKPDKDGSLVPAVAESYEISDDATTYTFTLRDGVKFHDGSTVTADDVVFSIERCADASDGNPLAPVYSKIKSVEKKDDRTIVITLNEPDSEFLPYLTAAIVPADNSDYENNPVGTGPYKFVSRTPGENIVLQKFDDYWGDGTNGGNPAQIDSVTIKPVTNSDMIVTSLQGGNVDVFTHLSSDQTAQLGDGFEIAEGTMNLVQALYLNNSYEPFKNVKVRQALCYALDRQKIFDAISDGKGTAIGSAVYPAYSKYFCPELVDTYSTDTDKAKELLKEAGYPDGFEFTITVPSNYAPHVNTATVLQQELKEIGVTADIQEVEWETWLSDVYQNRDYESTVIGVDASALNASSLLGRYESSASNNFVNYSNPDYDETYEKALAATDDTEKTSLYKECEKILSEDAASVYIQDLPDFAAMDSRVTGFEFYPLYVLDLTALKLKEQ